MGGCPAVNISVKLSALCPHLEPAAPEYVSREARGRLRPLLRLARERGAFINFDMEQYRYRDLVQMAFTDLLLEDEFRDNPHVGIVVQAYLRDALDDVARLRALAETRGTPFSVRLVKGAYWDEENIVAAQNSWRSCLGRAVQTQLRGPHRRPVDAWPHCARRRQPQPRSVAQRSQGARVSAIAISSSRCYTGWPRTC
jgi:hypothetical protein